MNDLSIHDYKLPRIKTTYIKNGFIFKQVSRQDNITIYSQHSTEHGPAIFYEVFRVQKRKEQVMPSGFLAPERETCPPNEQWGLEGFTFRNLADAEAKAIFLHQKADRRKNATMQQ